MDKSPTSGCVEGDGGIGNYTKSSQNPENLKHQSWPCTSNTGERKNYKRAANRGKKGSQVLSDRSYSTVRVLRSTSASKQSPTDVVAQPVAKKSPDTVHTLVQPAAKRIKRNRPAVRALDNEFSKIRQRVRYILNRMNYEQSLLQAYASEGWKRQSLEKIRPEMELERAKAEILRCKLRIREAFQNLDRLLSAGKLAESLFDAKGEISSEDIFCGTCGLQNVTLNNDIILCDGVCDRGFHQKCLNPPLLTKDIPAGDEGWLCPACDCKIYCVDVINELQGTNLSLSDSWEKVFPEAVALAHGSKQNDVSDLPSDDSEDNDFDPNIAEEYVGGLDEGSSEDDAYEGSDSDDSNIITSSDNSKHLEDKEKVDDLGLPSEDSEDDDYDPAGPDSDKDIEEKHNESDFTSDSDDFCAEIAKSCGLNEVSSGAKSGDPTNDSEEAIFQLKTSMPNPISKDPQINRDAALPVPGRRQIQRLDYKKLYDDAYGEAPLDSSDDEEWSGKSTPEKDNEEQNEMDSSRKSFKETEAVQQNNELTPQSAQQNLHPDGFHGSVNGEHARELTTNGSNNNITERRQFDELGLPSEDSEDDDYDPVGPDSDIDTKKKKSSSSDSDFSSDSDDFCAEIAKSCGQEGIPSGAKAGGDSTNDLEGTTLRGNSSISDLPSKVHEIDQNVVLTAPSDAKAGRDPVNDLEGTKLQANTSISNLPSEDLQLDQHVVLPVSARQQNGDQGETSADLNGDEDLSGKSIPEKDNGRHSEAGSFSRKSSSGTGTVHQSNKSTQPSLHRDAFHGSVNAHDAQETPNGSSSVTQRKYGPIISQRLHEHFNTDQYPCRAVKERLGQELGLTFRQVNKWFETKRHYTRVTASKNDSHSQNHRSNGNKSSFAAHTEATDSKEMVVEKLHVCKNVNEGIQQDIPQKPDFSDGLRTHVTPPEGCQRYTTTSGLVGRSKGESRCNNSKGIPSRYAAKPKDDFAEDVVLGLEVVDEGAKKGALRGLKKRKMSG